MARPAAPKAPRTRKKETRKGGDRHLPTAARLSGKKAGGWDRLKKEHTKLRCEAAAERLRLNKIIQALTPLAQRVKDLEVHLADQRASLSMAELSLDRLRMEKQQLELQAQRRVMQLTQALQEVKEERDAEMEAHQKTRALCAQRLQFLEQSRSPAPAGRPRGAAAGLAAEFGARARKQR